jgi:hypothetical protein
LQWPRAAVAGGIGLVLSIVAHDLPRHFVAPALGAITALVMVVPCYMIILSILWLRLKRLAGRSNGYVAEYGWIIQAVQLAPIVATLAAAAIGALVAI